MDILATFYGPNAGYVFDLYEQYKQDPASVDATTRAIFATWSPEEQTWPPSSSSQNGHAQPEATETRGQNASAPTERSIQERITRVVAASALAHAIRERGHLGAHLDPLGSEPPGDAALLPEAYGLSEADLAQLPPEVIGGHAAEGVLNALEAINALRAMYSGSISYEFDQVKSADERRWLRDAVGLNLYHTVPTAREVRTLLKRLTQVEVFERYLQQILPGQKRFSIEGLDILVPMLDEIIGGAFESETKEIIIGMAHRGRLNVLTHVLGKHYGAILAEFAHARHEEGTPLTDTFGFGWTGDVKYHLGAENVLHENAEAMKVVLAPNPSHLEFVNPVIQGMARASQEIRATSGSPIQDVDNTLPIIIHGDAAFPGEGVVAETMNLWHLRGYWVGGTIHIIANNQIGFTTLPEDSRSTHFASDVAKGFGIPIIHVNADNPRSCLTAVRIAHAYRDQFHKDVLIDLVGYRRWGHNEGDEPGFTQPRMYDAIRSHPTVRELYTQHAIEEGTIVQEEADTLVKDAFAILEKAKHEADEGLYDVEVNILASNEYEGDSFLEANPAPLSAELLQKFNAKLLDWPQDFPLNPKLARMLQRRASTLGPEGGIDWGQAEALAFASILATGTPIRLTGQDTERGTFSHRHAALHSQDEGETYIPLQHLPQARAAFSIYNSPLSEVGALGFEYGYSVHAPETMVLWEAQFGDFANVAQIIIDQFIASGRAKWRQDSSLILLLPHGYEGQGPEHSSARLERYLQLAAEGNWRIANCSTSAQYFHLLRQQAATLQSCPRPLVVMTPKSLLRHPLSSSRLQDLSEGHFQPVIDDLKARTQPQRIRRILLCTGKIAIDLLSHASRTRSEDTAIVRIELLYPFPAEQLRQVLAGYPNAHEVIWVQEEPHNMGAWKYVVARLTPLVENRFTLNIISRPDRSSPAAGFWDLYTAEQEYILAEASGLSLKQPGEEHVR
jgi:2-oxoglutarate dehydrogenase E1 component